MEIVDSLQLWNNVGIVRQYSSEDENSIDVEFHDTSVHHALHLNNNSGHSMAALSTQALALACDAQDDQPRLVPLPRFLPVNKQESTVLGDEICV